jgi:hypothetical protein
MVVKVNVPREQYVPVPEITNPLAQSRPDLPPEMTQSAGVQVPPPIYTPASFEARREAAQAPIPENVQATASPQGEVDWAAMEQQPEQFYGGDPGRGRMQGPQTYPDVNKSSYWEGGVTRGGLAQAPDELAENIKNDKDREKQIAGILGLGWRTKDELKNTFSDAVKTHHVGTLHRTALELGEALGRVQVTSESERGVTRGSAFDKIKETYNVDNTQVANGATVALSMFLPIMSGATERSPTSSVDAVDALNSLIGGDLTMGAGQVTEGGIERGTSRKILGSLGNKLFSMANNLVDAQGNPIDPSTVGRDTMTPEEAGALIETAAIDAGLLTSMKNDQGVEFLRINPLYGHDLYMASKDMSSEFTESMLGRATTAPVTDIGEYRTAQRGVRHGDKHKGFGAETREMVEVNRILGSTAMLVSPMRSWLAAALVKLGMDYHNGQGVNTTKHAMIAMGDKPEEGADPKEVSKWNRELRTKMSTATKLLKGYAKFVQMGTTQFAKHWEDPTVHRSYNDTNDLNPQRHIMTRGVISATELPRTFRSSLHTTGITAPIANKWWEDIGSFMKSDREDYSFKSAHMDEMNFLYTVAHALDIGNYHDKSRETASYTPADLVRLLTPDRMVLFADFGNKL